MQIIGAVIEQVCRVLCGDSYATLELGAAYLRGANLRGANLLGADLRGANLEGADLEGADLLGADLRGAYLLGADLRGAYLEGAYLEGADLEGADLRGAYLEGAYLRGADLRGADLLGADLRGVYLLGADLRGAYLEGAIGFRYHDAPDPADLRGKVADHIEAHPELHNQEAWGDGSDDPACGTPCCVAGWACHLGGGSRGDRVASAAIRLLWLDGHPMPRFDEGASREEIIAALRS